jgi:hypothetical protein
MIKISFFKKIALFIGVFAVFISCNRDDLNEMKSIHLKLVSNYTEQPIDQTFIFAVEGDNRDVITSESQFLVNGVAITGNTFTPTSEGIYQVQATYLGFTSQIITVKAITPSDYSQKVLVEDYTGTWCGWCPRVAYAIQQVKLQSNKVVSVAIHSEDIYSSSNTPLMESTFGIESYPTAKINRINTWAPNHEPEHLEEVLNRTGFNAPLGLAIATNTSGNTINATIRVGFANNYSENLNLVVYLLENGLVSNQTNYTTYFGGASNIPNFVHNDVLRAIYTPLLGSPIPTSETIDDHIYNYQLSQPIPTSVVQNNNLHLIAFVVKASTKEVINVQEVPVGSEVGFE